MNYTEKTPKTQGQSPLSRTHTTFRTCKPAFRCKDHQKCATCRHIWIKQQISKYTDHLSAATLSRYKRAYYITINPTEMRLDIEESTAMIDHYVRSLIRGKRASCSMLHKSEYIFIKEISYTKELGYHAHYNLILFTDQKIEGDHKGDLFKDDYRYNVSVLKRSLDQDHSKSSYNHKSPLIQNIKNVIAYSLKTDPNRMRLERVSSVSKGKHDVLASHYFSFKPAKKHTKFSIHINEIKAARKAARQAREHALRLHACYKVLHPNASSIAIHRSAVKTQRRIKRINKQTEALIIKLKAAQQPPERIKTRTHYIKNKPKQKNYD